MRPSRSLNLEHWSFPECWILEFGAFSSPTSLRIQILLQFFRRHVALDAIRRHFPFRRPYDGVEHQFPEIVVSPVLVKMSASKSEPASTIRPLACPGDTLRFAAFDCIPRRRVPAVCAIRTFHCAC